jgi:hypothetical protein
MAHIGESQPKTIHRNFEEAQTMQIQEVKKMETRLYRIYVPIEKKYYKWNYSDQWLTDKEKNDLENSFECRIIPTSLVGIASEKELNKYTWHK